MFYSPTISHAQYLTPVPPVVWLLGVSLSMDALAIAITGGMTLQPFLVRYGVCMAGYFGVFQCLMPLLGYLLGSAVSGYVHTLGPYISFFLLSFIGLRMVLENLHPDEQLFGPAMTCLSHRRLLLLAIATSIDALAVGVSFAFTDLPLLRSCLCIGLTTFLLCLGGTMLGHMGARFFSGRYAGILGGCVLVGIGLHMLLAAK